MDLVDPYGGRTHTGPSGGVDRQEWKDAMAETQSCTLNRNWVLKTGVFLIVLVGFGCWALYDAASLYPARGLADASRKLRDYLVAADSAGFLRADKTVAANPGSELATLSAKIDDLRGAVSRGGGEGRAAAMDLARHEWLSALDRAWNLNTKPKPLGAYSAPVKKSLWFDMTTGEGYSTTPEGAKTQLTPQALRDELVTFWSQAPAQPTALSAWDIPVQWFFVLIGFGLGGYLLFLIIKCKAQASRTKFEPDAQRLTVPTGASFTPSELEDVDKRLWHKYYVTMQLKDGSHHKLDLLRYVPLEDWVLAMERTRFPERAAEEEKKAAAEDAAAIAAESGDSDESDEPKA